MKKITVLGATGSIGRSTLDVIRKNPFDFEPVLFSAQSDKAGLLTLRKEFPGAKLAFSGGNCEGADYTGREGLLQAIAECGADIAVNGIAGGAGLEPSLAVIDAGVDLALANKETVVMAGEIVFAKALEKNAQIIPVDSEHSAVFQLLRAHSKENLDSIILTASGGPFRTFSLEQLAEVKPKDALNHPTWKMGAKITVDSATMANKGLEVIEAVKLFDVSPDRVKVTVHPQSIVHSMLCFADGSLYAQLSEPDMRRPIQDALFFPKKGKASFDNLDFSALSLTFENPDGEKFPLLPLAYDAVRAGGLYPAVYNAANETAVSLFLEEKIGFLDIACAVGKVLQEDWSGAQTLEAIFDADKRARRLTYSICLKQIS